MMRSDQPMKPAALINENCRQIGNLRYSQAKSISTQNVTHTLSRPGMPLANPMI